MPSNSKREDFDGRFVNACNSLKELNRFELVDLIEEHEHFEMNGSFSKLFPNVYHLGNDGNIYLMGYDSIEYLAAVEVAREKGIAKGMQIKEIYRRKD